MYVDNDNVDNYVLFLDRSLYSYQNNTKQSKIHSFWEMPQPFNSNRILNSNLVKNFFLNQPFKKNVFNKDYCGL